jgi:hypothetical protein
MYRLLMIACRMAKDQRQVNRAALAAAILSQPQRPHYCPYFNIISGGPKRRTCHLPMRGAARQGKLVETGGWGNRRQDDANLFSAAA